MLNHDQLQQCKDELTERQSQIAAHLSDHFGLDQELLKSSVSELANYDNHPADTGTELYEREKDVALNDHSEQELKDIEKALQAIDDGNYGICEVCNEDIPTDRMLAMPTTKRCRKHAEQSVKRTRPIEEDILDANIQMTDTELAEEESVIFDREDAWQQVEKYGSSDGPSDFYDTEKDYDNMYYHSDELVGSAEDVESFLLADSHGKYIGVNEKHEAYEDYLDETDVGSILYTDR
ncbi:TraR/DksA family transcriptional regulator [Gracilibacillus halophilus YIM-C55.5]|uniref:TraR/DksA family transcriptional regulator n=1 Tax=Gracilibacillus halophilus YIM-C55.5 TaxID=1308866 RepID=N4WLZ2_9BACI|nr:TraR/DksA C4-type zinc finger protein [Gracilibacillus halophilus]ENH97182.1 TraR/DksA family transcriptional regulator [Gracilibacillus halophilus YIM-C55.5]